MDESLDAVLELVRELVAAGAEDLDAVVGHRVVAGRQDDPEIGAAGRYGVSNSRGRDDAELNHVSAGPCHPGSHRRLEELA